MDNLHTIVLTLTLVSSLTHAAIIGSDDFNSYPDGDIAGHAGGAGWNWDNTGKSNTITVSEWKNLENSTSQVSSGALRTSNSKSKRSFNGPIEGEESDTDERLGAFRSVGMLYVHTTLKWNNVNAWSGVSLLDFDRERWFYGVPYQTSDTKYFGVESIGRQLSTVPVVVGQTYTLVAELNFNSDAVRMWIDPASGCDAPIIEQLMSANTWCTAVRVASGGETLWDDLIIASHWSELGLEPKTGLLFYEGFEGYTSTNNLPGQTVQGTGFRMGSVWAVSESENSKVETNNLVYPRLIVSDHNAMCTIKGNGGQGTHAYFDFGAFDRAGLLGSDTYQGTGSQDSLLVGGSGVEGTLYYSFLARSNSGFKANAFGGLHLYRDNREVCLVGNNWAETMFGALVDERVNLNSANSDRAEDNFEEIDSETHLFVVKIDYHADANDDISVWLDPNVILPENEQNSATKTVRHAVSDLSFNRIHLRGGNAENSWSFDEIRFGTTWRAVLPVIEYPAGSTIIIN